MDPDVWLSRRAKCNRSELRQSHHSLRQMPIRPTKSDTGTEIYLRIDLLKLRLVLTNGIGTVNDCFVSENSHPLRFTINSWLETSAHKLTAFSAEAAAIRPAVAGAAVCQLRLTARP